VMVVLPASGCEMIAKVLLNFTSSQIEFGDILYFSFNPKTAMYSN